MKRFARLCGTSPNRRGISPIHKAWITIGQRTKLFTPADQKIAVTRRRQSCQDVRGIIRARDAPHQLGEGTMLSSTMTTTAIRYQNPVWPGYFADPHALKTPHRYYAYGTGPVGADGRAFPILRSSDLVHWEPVGGALEPLSNPTALNYWAPEVTENDGRYY